MNKKRRNLTLAPLILLVSGCTNEGWEINGDVIQSESGIITFATLKTRTFGLLDAFGAHSDVRKLTSSKTIAIQTVITPDGPQSKILDFSYNWKLGDPVAAGSPIFYVAGKHIIAVPCAEFGNARKRYESLSVNSCIKKAQGEFIESGGNSRLAFSTSGNAINILQNSISAPPKTTIDLAALKTKSECTTFRTPKYDFTPNYSTKLATEKRCALDFFYKQNGSSFAVHYGENIDIYEVQSGKIIGKASTNFSVKDYEITDIVRSGNVIEYIYCNNDYNKDKKI